MTFNFDSLLTQVLQPYFCYSIAFLMIAFICVKIFLKYNPNLSSRTRSIFWTIPLIIPIFVLITFPPGTQISLPTSQSPIVIGAPTVVGYVAAVGSCTGVEFISSGSIVIQSVSPPAVPSVTGLICLFGAVAAVTYFGVTLLLGHRIARRIFQVVMLSPEEYTSLQEKIREIAQKMGVPTPKVGLIEDLRPNAFTLGHGRETVIVFSLGILNLLNKEELTAVAAHELSHVKANDYFFKILANSLNILSFFNPLSYFALSEAEKERELLADERGTKLLKQPLLMANVLMKIGKALKSFPKENLTAWLSTSLFLISPLTHRAQILATHPQIAQRVYNISRLTSKPKQKQIRSITAALLSFTLVLAAVVASYSVIQFQTSYLHNDVEYTGVAASTSILDGPQSYGFALSDQTSPQPVEVAPLPTQQCPEISSFDALFSPQEIGIVQIEPDNSQVISRSPQEFISDNTFIRP